MRQLTGSIGQLRNRRWQVRWREAGGRQKAKNFRLKIQAQDFLRSLNLEPEEGSLPEVSFEAFAKDWHTRYCKVQKAESQWVTDWCLIKKHLIPAFGTRPLQSLARKDLLFLQASLKGEGQRSTKTINLIVALARKMLATAVEWELVALNPWAGIKLLRQQEQPFDFWSREERERFLSFARRQNPRLADIVAFACHTGLRQGEIRGLKRDCLDFERRTILVRRSWGRDVGGGTLLDYTKGKRVRQVEMNDVVFGILKDRRLMGGTAFVFDFNPQHLSRSLGRIAKAAEVKEIRFHDLRHTFASHLAMAGVPLQKIQYLLGHVDYKQTQRYAHLLPSSVDGITAILVSAQNVHSLQSRISGT